MQVGLGTAVPDGRDERARAVASAPKARQPLAIAGNTLPTPAQPAADQQASHMHAVVPAQQAALADCHNAPRRVAANTSGRDLVPPHTAAAVSTAYAALGQSRQIAEAAAAAAAATISRHKGLLFGKFPRVTCTQTCLCPRLQQLGRQHW